MTALIILLCGICKSFNHTLDTGQTKRVDVKLTDNIVSQYLLGIYPAVATTS